jgi:phytoene dehydrogenase-like protein
MIKVLFRISALVSPGFHEEGATEEQSMKLAYCKPATAAPDLKPQNWTDVRLCLEQCHASVAHQPDSVARRLNRLLKRFAKALEHGGDDLFAQARHLEETVAWLAALRGTHEETLRLQRSLARLMHEVFRTPEWRRALITGL